MLDWPPSVFLEPLATTYLDQFNAAGIAGIQIDIKRDDLIHHGVSGNKWFKLFYNVQQAKSENASSIVSFGGAWSNHLHALAHLGAQEQIQTIGLVRGGEVLNSPSDCIRDCQSLGMNIIPVSRERYRTRYQPPTATSWPEIKSFDTTFWVPEGGNNALGQQGCREILLGVPLVNYDVIYLAIGTGATFKGISDYLNDIDWQGILVGVPAGNKFEDRLIKEGAASYLNELNAHLPVSGMKPLIQIEAMLGRYGKVSNDLAAEWLDFEQKTGVLLDPVYTLRVAYALKQALLAGRIRPLKKVLFIHTGGLQGRRGYQP